jgi:hypothetical protein
MNPIPTHRRRRGNESHLCSADFPICRPADSLRAPHPRTTPNRAGTIRKRNEHILPHRVSIRPTGTCTLHAIRPWEFLGICYLAFGHSSAQTPNGVSSQSPGLRNRRYPGCRQNHRFYPNGVAAACSPHFPPRALRQKFPSPHSSFRRGSNQQTNDNNKTETNEKL